MPIFLIPRFGNPNPNPDSPNPNPNPNLLGQEIAVRIDDAQVKVVVAASCGVNPGPKVVEYAPLIRGAMEMATHKPEGGMQLYR